MITVRFACGHEVTVQATETDAPVCPRCADKRITRVVAPPPKFRGMGSGPCHQEDR